MKILGFETASGRCSVAITKDQEVLAAEILTTQSMQAEQLLSMIEKVLANANLELSDIEYIATTSGPGSFTGIRIGLATALGLTMATDIKPVIVTNFATINFRIREQMRGFDYAAAIIDAYRGECYFNLFDKQNQTIEEPKLLKLEDVSKELQKLNGEIVCAGNSCHKLLFEHDLHKLPFVRVLPRFPNPDARSLCRLANTQILKGVYNTNIEPLYIRPPDAKLPLASSGIVRSISTHPARLLHG